VPRPGRDSVCKSREILSPVSLVCDNHSDWSKYFIVTNRIDLTRKLSPHAEGYGNNAQFLGNFLLEKSIEPRFLSNKTGDEDT
jgi:hypothetical protein